MRCGNPTSFPAYRFPLPSREVKIINFDLPHSKFTGVNECIVQYVRGEKKKKRRKQVIPPGIEPGTLSVLDSRDNHYTMESAAGIVVSVLVLQQQFTL